ncbi:MAG: LptF/LptG family permease [Nitrospiraceae bacterium]|nr:LptF/LptG family permease [Nitrospiraceae bacterium]
MRIYTIHKEILKELALTFCLSVVALNFILMMEKILKLSRLFSVVGASFFDLVKIILYLQPPMLILTLPMSLLVATLITYGRMNTDNEIIILKSSGMHFRMIAMPVFALGISCFLAGILVSFYLGPASMIKLRETVSNVLTSRAPAAIEEGVFTSIFKDIMVYVKNKPESNTVREVFVYDERNKKEPKVIMAKEGKISVTDEFRMSFYLKDGYIHFVKGDSSTEVYFAGYNMSMGFSGDPPSKKKNELTPLELYNEFKKQSGQDAVSFILEFHRRLSLPSVCLLLMLLGPPLSLIAGKTGRLGGLTLGLSVFVAFYILLIYGENMARNGKITHYLGGWAPVIVLGILAVFLFRRESNK